MKTNIISLADLAHVVGGTLRPDPPRPGGPGPYNPNPDPWERGTKGRTPNRKLQAA